MKLTPLDIKKQEFKKVLRGYDTEEVNSFLEMMSNEFADLLRQAKELKEQSIENEVLLRDFRQKEKDLQQVLMQAQETSAKTVENAKKEAELIVQEAELKGNQILDRVRVDVGRAKEEVIMLQAKKESLVSRLKILLNSELELIKSVEAEEDGMRNSSRGTGKENFQIDEVLKKL